MMTFHFLLKIITSLYIEEANLSKMGLFVVENTFEHRYYPVTSIMSGKSIDTSSDLHCFTTQIVNVTFAGPYQGQWVLIDTGMPSSADNILDEANKRFGSSKPKAIILTHGHFDHVGSIVELIEEWQCPVYAHKLELPYLTGEENYPPPDPSVDGGLITEMSRFFPNKSINLGDMVRELPIDGTVPDMPEWKWLHTPGHTPGHISLYRSSDRTLIAGDAFITVKQESLFKVLGQVQEIHGPPAYYTTDWQSAWNSVKKLDALKPAIAITGHGKPMSGDILSQELHRLATEFDTIAIPKHGKYLH